MNKIITDTSTRKGGKGASRGGADGARPSPQGVCAILTHDKRL